MAAIHDLLAQVQDEALRARLEQEINRLSKTKKFGLVFEEHLPECTPLYDISVKKGSTVAKKTGAVSEMYEVNSVKDGIATCYHKVTGEKEEIPADELVCVAQFGEPIYPYLKYIDSVCNAPDSELWHTLIEADNYHALQLLEYLYAGKIDCIYIDPPYNTGAKDWKYNNNYVDGVDAYRHSKWLSFMEKRLRLAKKLLNPSTGTMIVTIDEHEVHHLRCLLEELFPEAFIQMATVVINQKGVAQGRLARVEEYAIYVFMPNAFVPAYHDDLLSQTELPTTISAPRWERLLRGGNNSRREDRPLMFYPVYIDPELKKVTGIGPIMPLGENPDMTMPDDRKTAWPFRSDGSLGHWQLQPSTFKELLELGFVKVGTYDKKRKTWTILYLNKGTRKRIDEGDIKITSRDPVTGSVNIEFTRVEAKMYNVKTVWHRKLHDSGVYGSTLLTNIIGRDVKFDFPKAIYSTKDAIANVVRNNPDAIILDFFAGSGTTLNAVNLLNAEDGGKRRCILVTNNECSDADSKTLIKQEHIPGDKEWENKGICRSVTWPRTKYTITGKDKNYIPLEGEYYTDLTQEVPLERKVTQITIADDINEIKNKKEIVNLIGKGTLPASMVSELPFVVSDNSSHNISILFDADYVDDWIETLQSLNHINDLYIVAKDKKLFDSINEKIKSELQPLYKQIPLKRKISEGFQTNAVYFKLGFLDKNNVALGRQLAELLPVLWLKAGAHGSCPQVEDDKVHLMVFPENRFAILKDEKYFQEFDAEVLRHPEIQTIYIVTDSEAGYREMISGYAGKDTFQLYRDYLDNFRINTGR